MEHDLFINNVEALLDEKSMPEIVAALIYISRSYKQRLQQEDNREYIGWENWELALSTVINDVEGPEELNELLGDFQVIP